MVLLNQVNHILSEYQAYLPMTLRQIFYRLVGAYGYDKTEKAYGRLGEHVNRARRARLIPFSAIRDDGITSTHPMAWDSPEALIRMFVRGAGEFRLDRQQGQPRRLIFAIEAAGMIPMVENVADPFGISAVSCGGFDSTTNKYDLATSLGRWRQVEVLHIGDHDPSGVHMFSSVAEDVQAIARDLRLDIDIAFTRLAVTPAQIAALGLPTMPPKPTDRRSFSGETTQAEAIAPNVLAGIIRGAIEERLDRDAYDAVLNEEKATRRDLSARLRPLLQEFGA